MDAAKTLEDEAKHADKIVITVRLTHRGEDCWLWFELAPYSRRWHAGQVDADGPRKTHQWADYRAATLDSAQERLDGSTIHPGTVEVRVSKGRVKAKDLKDTAITAVCDAWAIEVPDDATLKAEQKAFRERKKAEKAEKARRKEQAAAAEQAQVEAERAATRPTKAVTDLSSFLSAIARRADSKKLKKALKMLKADRFELFDDVKDTEVVGVVKSQTDPKLRYACRLTEGGVYSCCTQNLNVCGGLRGSACKHLLVLVIGLVKAGQLDPGAADRWIEKTIGVKPELDRDVMSEVFLRYQGAEAGEVDWRPTETVPEDFYAF